MITRVSIKKVASYGETPAILETDKKINLIYGLNGAGKTKIETENARKICSSIKGSTYEAIRERMDCINKNTNTGDVETKCPRPF